MDCKYKSPHILSFRTERSVVKNLDNIHVDAPEILRFALNDKNVQD